MCQTCTSLTPAPEAGNTFAEKLLGHLNGAAIMLMTSIGHRTGLLDAMGDGVARTSAALAQQSHLSERYVREWLGAMTTGGIVQYSPASKTYHLPPEHAALLTRAAAPTNFAATSQWISVLGGVESRVVEAFVHGKGVGYDAYERFHDVMAEESGQTTLGGIDEHIIPLIDGLEARLQKGIEVADVGCGRGLAILHLANRFPSSRFVGLDLNDAAIASAREEASRRGLTNVQFEKCDLTTWKTNRRFDLITAFDAIHDQARPDLVLQSVNRALHSDGVFLMQDIKASSHVEKNLGHPLAPFIYTISCMHCMSVSLAQGGMGLGAAWGEELARNMLSDAGFTDVTVRELPHDMINIYYICRRHAQVR
jgi:SAM-dependent methyltransferase